MTGVPASFAGGVDEIPWRCKYFSRRAAIGEELAAVIGCAALEDVIDGLVSDVHDYLASLDAAVVT